MTKTESRWAMIGGGVLALVVVGYLANSLLLAPLREAQDRHDELEKRLDKAQALLDQRGNFIRTWQDVTARLPGADPVKSAPWAAERVNAILNSVLPFRLSVGRPTTGVYGKTNFKQIFMPVTGTLSLLQLVNLLASIYEERTLVQIRSFSLAPESSRAPGQMRLNMQLASLSVPPDPFVKKYAGTAPPAGTPAPMLRSAMEPKQIRLVSLSEATPTPRPTPVPPPDSTPGPAPPAPLHLREYYDDPESGPRAVLVDANGENAKIVKIGETVGPAQVLYLHGTYGMVLGEGHKTYIVPWGTTTDAKMVLNAEEYPELMQEMRARQIVLPGM